MYKKDWKQEFPEVPKEFHNRVESTLAEIFTEKNRRLSRKGIAAIILASVLTIGSITAVASGYFQWNIKLAEIFGVNKMQQNNLIEKGVTEQKNANATDNGLTVSLVQTLQDKKYLYILLEVKAPENIKLTDTNLFEVNNIDVSGEKGYYSSISSGFMDLVNEPQITNKRYYEYWINKESNLDGKDITLHLKNLQADLGKLDMRTILEGDWTLTWKMTYKDSTKCFYLNKAENLSGYKVLVKRIEISPLSMTVYFDGEDIRSMEKAEKVNLEKLDTLNPIMFKGIKYTDGTSVTILGGPGEEAFNKTTGEYKVSTAFDKVIDTEKLEGLLFGADNSEIELK